MDLGAVVTPLEPARRAFLDRRGRLVLEGGTPIVGRPACEGSGRVWTGGTGSPICPVCHRGYRSMVGRDARRPRIGVTTVPIHEGRER